MRHLSPPTVLFCLMLCGPVCAQGVDAPEPSVSAEQVQAAIRASVEYLYRQQTDRADWEEVPNREAYTGQEHEGKSKLAYGGRTALVVLALLYAGEDPASEKLKKSLKWLAEVELTGTYATGIRAGVWSRLKDPKLRPLLLRDGQWLMEAATRPDGTIPGDFSYSRPQPGYSDYSNTQYGVLGLRDASIRGVEVPMKYWEAIEKNMIENQAPNGGWGYHRKAAANETYGNMTVGCLANLYITLDRLQTSFEGRFTGREARGCGRRQPPEAIAKGLAWLDRNLPVDFGLKQGGDPQTRGGHGMGLYYLYGLERCANASGRKTFGGLNWFEQGAKWILSKQGTDGAFNFHHGGSVNTAWAVLFLSKGQAPVFYNKLDTHADWCNDLRDIPNLSEYIGEELEQRVNWQVVDIDDPVEQWLDAPVLFFNGHDIPKFTDEQKQKLRLYTDSGGTLVAEACCSQVNFIKGFQKLARDVWPEWELQALDRKHPVFEFHHRLTGRTPRTMHLHDGCRSRVFFLMEDASCAWNQNLLLTYPSYFQFGMNLARYASDKRAMRSRLYHVPNLFKELAAQGKPVPAAPAAETKIALADWLTDGKRLTDIRAMRHLAETLKEGFNVALDTVTFSDNVLDGLDRVKILHMSGHHTFVVSDEDLARLRDFVKNGGLIWADAQCGREGFRESFEKFAKDLVADAQLADVPPEDAIVTGGDLSIAGFDVRRIRYKQSLKLNEFAPSLREIRIGGRRALVYSPRDLTCGMDGHDCPNCLGPERNDALKMAANIVLSSLPPRDAGAPADAP